MSVILYARTAANVITVSVAACDERQQRQNTTRDNIINIIIVSEYIGVSCGSPGNVARSDNTERASDSAGECVSVCVRACVFTRLFGGAYRWPTDGQVPPPRCRCPRLVATTRPRRGHGPVIGRPAAAPTPHWPPRTGCASDYQRSRRRRPSLAPRRPYYIIVLWYHDDGNNIVYYNILYAYRIE